MSTAVDALWYEIAGGNEMDHRMIVSNYGNIETPIECKNCTFQTFTYKLWLY